MVTYICELCKKNFKQKEDFVKHQKRKSPCVSLETIAEKTKMETIKENNVQSLRNMFKGCLDILRDSEHLTGDKALRTLAHLLVIRLIETKLDEMKIDEYDFSLDDWEDDEKDAVKKHLLTNIRFTSLVKTKEDNIPKLMKALWNDILSEHPKTKDIFIKGKGFDITHQSTYTKLFKKLNEFDFSSIEADIQGEAYEEVVKDIMTGKVLGQFFTPPEVKQMMVEWVKPQVLKDGTIETIFDPAMGTGGFLITSLRYLIKDADKKETKLNWDFISKQGLGGREAEPDTYQLARANMLISSGHMFDVLERDDSIRNPITKKYDVILTNPPFGIKGLNYDEIVSPLRDEYIPIKTNSAVPLFLQAIIHMLKVGGRCGIVLPDGQELFNKQSTLVAVREYLMKTCDLKQVVYMPSGVFTHTSIKTCVFFFTKKKEGTKTVSCKISTSGKTQKETKRMYKFSKTHITKKVNFLEFNPLTMEEKPLVSVPIEDIASNGYSLNHAEYLEDAEEDSKEYSEDVEVKTLGEVCEFIKTGKNKPKDNKKGTKYPYYGTGSITGYTDEYLYDGTYLLTARNGTIGNCFIVNDKFFPSDHIFVIDIKDKILLKYIYYYLSNNQQLINLKTGVGIPNITKKTLMNFKIPIPSLERQKEIVEQLDFIYEQCIKTSEQKIAQLKKLNEYCLKDQKRFGDNEVKTLGEVCEYKSGKRLPKGHKLLDTKTDYPYIRISDFKNNSVDLSNIKFLSKATYTLISKYIITVDDIYVSIAGTTGIAGCIPKKLNNSNLTENAVRLIIDDKIICKSFLIYELNINQKTVLQNKTKGTAVPKLAIGRLMEINLSIPSLERQKEIVEYCENNEDTIAKLEKEIEGNKDLANRIMNSIVKIKKPSEPKTKSSKSKTEGSSPKKIKIKLKK